MGRHSAGGDDAAAPEPEGPVRTVAPKPGRHARPQDDHDDDSAGPRPGPGIAGAELPSVAEGEAESAREPESDVESGPPPAMSRPKARPARGNQSTAADLALLREHSDVRARCIAAVVVPFVLYTATLYLIGAVHVYLIWVWIPLVAAGVLAGSILDVEHRRRSSEPPDR